MRTLATMAAGLALCLTLTACPGSYTSFQPHISPTGLGPMSLTFTSRSVYVNAPADGSSREQPMPLYASSYTLWAGDEVIWKIERTAPPPGMKCDWNDSPADITYGAAPPCYRETVPARPLEPGRSYRLQSEAHQRINFTYSDPIQMLSARGYAVRTRKWRDAHRR